MIKRLESSSSSSPTTPPSSAPVDHNGKDKKYSRHGSIFEVIQRWMALNGKFVVICVTAAILSVFLIPPLKVMLQVSSASEETIKQSSGSVAKALVASQKQQKTQQTLQIPPCPSSPWKPNENLQGKCPGDLKPNKDAATISQCASTCCAKEDCISWQFRKDTGCIQGKDIRLGMEKDGPAAWCSDHPPHRWKGQYTKPHGDKHKGMDEKQVREGACNLKTWNPDEEVGQCFGLGDVKKDASGSAEECMQACCKNEKCGAWQWNTELGCFYGRGMHSCQGKGDPIAFEPFVGRRKQLETRKYTDGHNKPWQMAMS